MLIINTAIRFSQGRALYCDANGSPADAPQITLGMRAQVDLDIRQEVWDPSTGELRPYDRTQLESAASWYIAIDQDFNQATAPLIVRSTDVGLAPADAAGATVVSARLPILDSEPLRAAIKEQQEVILLGELGGLNADGETIFVIPLQFRLFNRVYIPSDLAETPDPSDPAYLTTEQVRAYVTDQVTTAVADAVASLPPPKPGLPGDAGPAPELSIGRVTSGTTPSATLNFIGTPTAPAYSMDLVLVPGPKGDLPSLTMGEVNLNASEAEVSITPDSQSDGYFLNISLPPVESLHFSGSWNKNTEYPYNTCLRHNGAYWRAKQPSTGHEPPAILESDDYWDLMVADGRQAGQLVLQFSSDAYDVTLWHLYQNERDKWFRMSGDGGFTWGPIVQLQANPYVTVVQYASTLDPRYHWHLAEPAAQDATFTTVKNARYVRAIRKDGIKSSAAEIYPIDLLTGWTGTDFPQLRAMFGKGGPAAGNGAQEEAQQVIDHPVPYPGDNVIHFISSEISGIDMVMSFPPDDQQHPELGAQSIDHYEYSMSEEPWHYPRRPEDRYMRISFDSGATWEDVINLPGDPEDAPHDGRLYARCNGAWVPIGDTPEPPPPPPPAEATRIYYGYVADGVTSSVTALPTDVLSLDTCQSVDITDPTTLTITAVPGAVLFVLIPGAAPWKALQDDGLGGKVVFNEDIGAVGTGANGEVVTIGGAQYRVYGEFSLIDAEATIYIEVKK